MIASARKFKEQSKPEYDISIPRMDLHVIGKTANYDNSMNEYVGSTV